MELYWRVISMTCKYVDRRSGLFCVHASQSQRRRELKDTLTSLNASTVDPHDDEVFWIDLDGVVFCGAVLLRADTPVEYVG